MKKWILVAAGLLVGISLTLGVLNAADKKDEPTHYYEVWGFYRGPAVISDVIVTVNGNIYPPDYVADPMYRVHVPENLPLPWTVEFKDGGRTLCRKVITQITMPSIRVDCP